ncbi:MAG: DUF1877 family protein [Hymenobacter sp.]|nr:MAG: DUF1877 family protein [Hymenobacter sp.]
MALDLTLCLVPKQIEVLLSKAAHNADYAEWMQFIPEILKGSQPFGFQDKDFIQLKKDVASLKGFFQFTEDHYFYDTCRCFSTIDYLLDAHIRATASSVQPALLWEGGTKYPGVTAGQGMSIKLYDKATIEDIYLLLVDLEFSDLLVHYDYEKMQEIGVYKLTRPENLEMLELAFWEIQDIFLLAQSEGLLVFKAID